MLLTDDEINRRCAYHPPGSPDVVQAHDAVRSITRTVMHQYNALLPDCPEARRALDALDDAMMLANAAIARHGQPPSGWTPPAPPRPLRAVDQAPGEQAPGEQA